MLEKYITLGSKKGFNNSLQHFRVVTEIINFIQKGVNLSDIINDLESGDLVRKEQIPAILNAILIEKFNYSSLSFNLDSDLDYWENIYSKVKNWDKFDLVAAYHHPLLGISLFNPADIKSWDKIRGMAANDLIVLYIKALDSENKELESKALNSFKDLFLYKSDLDFPEYKKKIQTGKNIKEENKNIEDPETVQKADAKRPLEVKKRRVTPKYKVQVTNELFHNGNVEAWKNIIESYLTCYREAEVYIYHEGERINNINSLFKWGKVKNGDVILFSLAGNDIQGVAKLQRYLYEGASNRFMQFMKKDLHKKLRLF